MQSPINLFRTIRIRVMSVSCIIFFLHMVHIVLAENTITVSGHIRDNWWYPVANATLTISLSSEIFSTVTDSEGYYEIELPHLWTAIQEANTKPEAVVLSQNYPNPFNPSTVIEYSLAKDMLVRLDVFSVIGQKIRTLVNTHEVSGKHRVQWDGTDDAGNNIASGVYLYRLQAGTSCITNKMLLLDGGSHARISQTPSVSIMKPEITNEEYTLTVTCNGYENLNIDAWSIPFDNGSATSDIIMKRILPTGITDEDMTEIIRLAFFYASDYEYMWISDTVDMSNPSCLSVRNLDISLLPDIPHLQFILVDPEDIKDKAEREGTYWLFSFDPIIIDETAVTVFLNYVPIWSSKVIAPDFVGGGAKMEFTRKDGIWSAVLIGGYII